MQYMPSLQPNTRLSHSSALSLFPKVHNLSWFILPSVYRLPSFFPSFSYRSSYFLCSINERNHMIIVFLCLTFFTQHNLLQSCPRWYKLLGNRTFWWLSNIPFYIWTTSSLPIHVLKGISAPSMIYLLWTVLHEHWGAYGPSLHYVCIFGVNTQ